MVKSNLHEKYNMNMAAISILNSTISDIERRIKELQDESDEIIEKISNEDTEKRENKSFCRCGILAAYAPNGKCDICGLMKESK
jgi:predicted transcriptional regulator